MKDYLKLVALYLSVGITLTVSSYVVLALIALLINLL